MSRASTSVSGRWKCLYSRSCAAVNKSCSRHNFVVFVQKRGICVEKVRCFHNNSTFYSFIHTKNKVGFERIFLLLNIYSFLSLSSVLHVSPLSQWCTNMKLPELGDTISRFRLSQSCVGLAGCLCVLYAVWTPFWLKERGLWTEWNDTISDQINHKDIFSGKQRATFTSVKYFHRQQ